MIAWLRSGLGLGCLAWGCGLWLIASPPAAAAGEAHGEQVAEVAPAVADVRDRFDFRNAPVDLANHVSVGERLKYSVRASVMQLPMGSLELSCRRVRNIRQRPAFDLRLETLPNDIIASVYSGKTVITTNVDAATGRSLIYNCRETTTKGEDRREEYIQFDYDDAAESAAAPDPRTAPAGAMAQTVRNRIRGNGNREFRERKYPLPGDMQDALSLFYYGRGLPLRKVGDRVRVLVGGVSDVTAVALTVEAEEKLKLGRLGTADCLVVRPKAENAEGGGASLASFQGASRIWLEKNTRIPVKLEIDTGVPLIGNATALLTECDEANPIRRALTGGR